MCNKNISFILYCGIEAYAWLTTMMYSLLEEMMCKYKKHAKRE